MLKEFDQRLKEVRCQISSAGLHSSIEEKIGKRLNHFEENVRLLHERSLQTLTSLNNLKFDCEQILLDLKQMNEWLKTTEQQLNRYLPMHLHSQEEKSDASKRLLVSFLSHDESEGETRLVLRRNSTNLRSKKWKTNK